RRTVDTHLLHPLVRSAPHRSNSLVLEIASMLLTSTLRAAVAGSAIVLAAFAPPSPQTQQAHQAPQGQQGQQIQAFGGTAPRMAATRLFFAPQFQLKGMVCAQYGQPAWKAEYDGMLDKLKGKQLRLGEDFWATFNKTVRPDRGGQARPRRRHAPGRP